MPLTYKVNASAGDYDPAPAGSHIAVCDMVVDLGVQPGSGLYPAPKPQVFIRFELPHARIEFEKDGKKQEGPRVIGNTYTASMSEKANLRKILESWRGKKFTDPEAESFDVSAILGKPCMLMITQTAKGDKIYSNITAIGGLPPGIKASDIKAEITPILYAPPDNVANYEQLPKWLKDKIATQIVPEKRQQTTGADDEPPVSSYDNNPEITDDDIPF
jgi:hypothetical protein